MTDDADKAPQCFTSIRPASFKGGELVVVPRQLHQPKGPRLEQGLGSSESDGEGNVLRVSSIEGFSPNATKQNVALRFPLHTVLQPGQGCASLSGVFWGAARISLGLHRSWQCWLDIPAAS